LIDYTLNVRSSQAPGAQSTPEQREVFTDSGRTLRVETERKREGNEPEGARKSEGDREREGGGYKELDRECVKERREIGDR
jgi:hypothetical protein